MQEIPLFKNYKILGFFSKKISKTEVSKVYSHIFFPKQIHSDIIIEVSSPLISFSKEGDAVITTLKGQTIGVQSADCVPLLIAHKEKKVVAAVHAGWRGTLKKILYKTLNAIVNYGFKAEDLLIAIGPHIQASCYEIGKEVLDNLETSFKKEPFLFKKNGKYYLNLAQLNLIQALEMGVKRENIWISEECTHCLAHKYHSYRREGNLNYTQIAIITS
ncbi:MAG: peptidoglycan editing factor PgeF [Caldimicrobium sp.]